MVGTLTSNNSAIFFWAEPEAFIFMDNFDLHLAAGIGVK